MLFKKHNLLLYVFDVWLVILAKLPDQTNPNDNSIFVKLIARVMLITT